MVKTLRRSRKRSRRHRTRRARRGGIWPGRGGGARRPGGLRYGGGLRGTNRAMKRRLQHKLTGYAR